MKLNKKRKQIREGQEGGRKGGGTVQVCPATVQLNLVWEEKGVQRVAESCGGRGGEGKGRGAMGGKGMGEKGRGMGKRK